MAIAENIKIGKELYPIQYTSNALRKLENSTGKTVQLIGLTLISGRAGWGMLQDILWAGLEGARLKLATAGVSVRPQPYSVEEVGDMIDDAEGPQVFWDDSSDNAQAVLRAWQSAFPKSRKEGEQSQRPTPVSEPTSASTGTNSATRPPSAESENSISGT